VNDNLRSGKWNKVTLNTQFVRSVYSVSHQFSWRLRYFFLVFKESNPYCFHRWRKNQ